MKMAENAMALHELASKTNAMNDLSRSIDAWDRIAKYTEPKLKTVDCYPEEERVVNVVVKHFGIA
ncbi:hypothetical protein N9R09_03200 [Porticoccaceae bacterium]|nr:hypothetical protein [Porticoccaceae bacterium]